MGFWRDFVFGGEAIPRPDLNVAETAPSARRAVDGMATGVLPPSRLDAPAVSVEAALGIAAVYRSVSVLVTSVGQMELGVFRGEAQISTPALIKKPNPFDTQQRFIKETVYCLATHGNAFWRVHRTDPTEAPVSLEVLDPASVTIKTDENGRRSYWVGQRELRDWQIRHLKLISRPGYALGVGPIQAAKDELLAAVHLRDFASNWFNTAGVPTGYLQLDRNFNATESAQIADAWTEFVRTHSIAVVPSGVKYEPLHVNPKDGQYLDVQQATITSIARLFGIPASLLLAEVNGNSMTYTNMEQAQLAFFQSTLALYVNEIEDAFTELVPRGQSVRFNEEQLLRMDTKTLWDVNKTKVDIGFTTGDELRSEAGKKPLPTTANDAPLQAAPEASDGSPSSTDPVS